MKHRLQVFLGIICILCLTATFACGETDNPDAFIKNPTFDNFVKVFNEVSSYTCSAPSQEESWGQVSYNSSISSGGKNIGHINERQTEEGLMVMQMITVVDESDAQKFDDWVSGISSST